MAVLLGKGDRVELAVFLAQEVKVVPYSVFDGDGLVQDLVAVIISLEAVVEGGKVSADEVQALVRYLFG